MEEEEDYNAARKAILSGNIGSVFESLKSNLERSIRKCSSLLLISTSIEMEFAETILEKCVLLAKSEVYKNVSHLIDLSQIVTCCCRLIRLCHDSEEDTVHHRTIYHFFTYLLDKSLHSEACELAKALCDLIRPKSSEYATQPLSEEKNTVAQNMYIQCWNAATQLQKQDHHLSLQLYSASLMHLCLTRQLLSVRQKLKQLTTFFINSGEKVQKIHSFVYDVWITFLESSIHLEKWDVVLRDGFKFVYDWLKCHRQYRSKNDKDILDLSLFKSAMQSTLRLCENFLSLDIIVEVIWEMIQFGSSFSFQESKKMAKVDGSRSDVCRWLKVLSTPEAKILHPELCGYLNFCLSCEAQKVYTGTSTQRRVYFTHPTPLELQSLFVWMLQYYNSVNVPSSGSKKSLTFSVYLSYCRLLLAEVKTMIFEVDDEPAVVEEKHSKCCFEVAHLLTDCLISCNATTEEKILLAIDLTSAGSLLYNKRLYTVAIPFLEPYCNLASSYLKRSPFNENTLDVKVDLVYKRFEFLIASYTDIGNLQKAFSTAAQGLAYFGLTVPNSFRYWLRMKRASPSERNWLVHRTIKRELELLEIVLPRDTIFQLLKLELIAYQSCGSLEEDSYQVVLDMLDVCKNTLQRGISNLEITRLIIFSNVPSKMKAEDTCRLAISFLQEAIENENQVLLAKASLATAYFWLYQIQWENVQKAALNTVICHPNSKLLPGSENDEKTCNIVAAYPHVNLATQEQLHSSLNKAVDLWEDLSKSSHVWSEEELGLLKVVAEIYITAQKVQQSLRLLSIMVQVGHKQKNPDLLLYGGSGMALFLVKQGLIGQAQVLLDAVEVAAKRHNDFAFLRIEYSFLHFQLVKAEICLYSAQVAKGLDCLTSVLSDVANEKKLKTILLIEVEANILRTKFGCIPSEMLESLPEKDRCHLLKQSPIMESLEALSWGTFLTKCIKDGTCSKKKVSEWFLYRQLFIKAGLDSAIILGQMYFDIGAPREARCYWKESLTMAQELLLISEGLQILLQLAHLDLLCGKENDCQHKTQYVLHMLHSSKPVDATIPSPTDQREENHHDSTRSSWLHAKNLDEEDEEEEENGFVTCSSPSKFSCHTPPSGHQHPNDCSCNICQCFGLKLMQLKASWLQETGVHDGNKALMESRVEDILASLKNFVQKCHPQIHVFHSLVLKTARLLKAQNFSLPPAEKLESLHSIDLLTFECQVVTSLVGLYSRKSEFKKALEIITSAIQRVEKGSRCTHMLAAVHAHLLFQKVFLVLQYSSSLQGQNWVEMLVGKDPIRQKAAIVSHTFQHDLISLSDEEETKTPIDKDSSPFCENDGSALTKNLLINAPQKKPTNIYGIRNFQEPNLDFINSPCKSKTTSTVETSSGNSVDASSSPQVQNLKQPLQSLNRIPPLAEEILVRKVARNTRLKECDEKSPTLAKVRPKGSRKTMNRENIPPVDIEMSRNEDVVLQSPEISRGGDERCLRNGKNLRSKVEAPVTESSQSRSSRRKVPDIELEASRPKYENGMAMECVQNKVEVSVVKSCQPGNNRTRKVRDIEVEASKCDKHVETVCVQSKVEALVIQSSHPGNSRRTKVGEVVMKSSKCDKDQETEGIRENISSFKVSTIGTAYEEQIVLSSPQPLHSDGTKELLEEDADGAECLKDIEKDLLCARSLIWHHPPSQTFANINLFIAMLLGFKNSTDQSESRTSAAHYFSESVGVTLRHQGTICMQKRLRKGNESGSVYSGDDVKENVLSFRNNCKNPASSVKAALDSIPSGWTVVQVCGINSTSIKSSNGFPTPDLVVCRYRKGQPPLFGFVTPRDKQTTFLKEFFKILEESSASLKNVSPEVWWTIRRGLDARMKYLCESMENIWLRWWKVLFLGNPVVGEKRIGAAAERLLKLGTKLGLKCRDQYLLQALLNASFSLGPEHLVRAVTYLWNTTQASNKSLCNAIMAETKWMNFAAIERHPVILILDKHVQKLPWECIPLLRNCVVTRVPSLHMLHAQLLSYTFRPEAVYRKGLDPRDTFYVLNTRNDLPHTQRKFEDMFKRLNWHGVVGRYPTNEEMVSAITEHDLFLYCGHGSGSTFLPGENIEKLQSRCAVVLMGCSSGHLRVLGEMEPMGIVQNYWLGGCPMVLANLWDVTDKDIDRFTENLLQNWLGEGGISACKAVVKARQVCMLPHLIGCAPVVYGLPIFSVGKLDFNVLGNHQ